MKYKIYFLILFSLFSQILSADELGCIRSREAIIETFAICAERYSEFDYYDKSFKYQYGQGIFSIGCLGTNPLSGWGSTNTVYRGGPFLSDCFGGTTQAKKRAVENPKPRLTCGSVIQASTQVLGEVIPLTGASFNLVYSSDRVIGRKADYKTSTQVTPAFIPSTVSNYSFEIKDENNNIIFSQNYNLPNISYTYEWNGIDSNLNETWGPVKRTISTKENASDLNLEPMSSAFFLGSLKAKKLGLGGWLPSNWHFYHSPSKILYNGDGSFRKVDGVIDGNYTRIASENGNEVYYFDNTGKIIFTKLALTGNTILTFAYDTSDRILSITEPFNRVTTFSRFLSGGLKAIIAPNSAKASITINSDGYLSKVINPNNEAYLMTYNGLGGLLKTFMPPNGDITTIEYDNEGNLISDIHSSGMGTSLTKNLTGIEALTTGGKKTVTIYNELAGSETTRTGGDNLEYLVSHSENSEQRDSPTGTEYYGYQNDSRFSGQARYMSFSNIDNFGSRNSTFTKDTLLSNPDDIYSIDTITEIEKIYRSIITSVYDGATRTKTRTTKLGRSSYVQLDEYERIIAERTGDLVEKNYSYTNNLLTKITHGTRKQILSYYSNELLKSVKNSLNQITTFTYDDAFRLKTKILPDSRIISYNYDSNGNLTSITPPGKSSHQLTFGLNDKMSSYSPPPLTGVSNVVTNYSYNNDKQITKIIRPDGQIINFGYQALSGLQTSISGNFGTYTIEYSKKLPFFVTDPEGNYLLQQHRGTTMSDITLIMGGSQIYNYSRFSASNAGEKVGSETVRGATNLGARTINYSYDDDEYLTRVGDLDLVYDSPNGLLTETTLNHVKDFYYYNAFGELRKYRAKYKSNVIYEYELERDSTGRITKKTETLNNITSVFEYSYDPAGRLIQVSTNGSVSSTYIYDSNGNRIGGIIRGENTVATYDAQDRLINYNGKNLTYNANGELLTKDNSNFVYDVFGNLKNYSKGNAVINYEIDPNRRRLGRIVNSKRTSRYIYNPDNKIVGQLDGNNKLIKTFVYASKSHVPDYYIDQNNNKVKIITDNLGSVRLLVANSGRIIQMMEHDEFGRVLQDTRPGFLPFGFAGGLYERTNKLVRFGARDYDPEIGRWLSKDPIRFDGKDSNLYGYVLQNPINLFDPSGLSPFDYLIPFGTGTGNGDIIGGTIGGGIGSGIGVIVGGPVGGYFGGFIGGELGGALGGTFDSGLAHDSDKVPRIPNYRPDQRRAIDEYNRKGPTTYPLPNINPNAWNGPNLTSRCR